MKLKILLLIFFIFLGSSFAQNSSTYSRVGIGDLTFSYSGRGLGIGESGVSVSGKDYISVLNPAGWNGLSMTRVEFGGTYKGLFISNNSLKKYYSETEFTGFTFGFPVSRLYGIGAALGIVPYSNVSYNSVEDVSSQNGIQGSKINYEGTGGLSKIFIGVSYKLPIEFSIGASLDYYFGNLKYSSVFDYDGTGSYKTTYLRAYRPNGVGTTIGIISPDFSNVLNSEKISDLRIGVAANIISNLSTDTLLTASSSVLSDTIAQGVVKMHIPMRISGGLSITLNQNYLINFDYFFQPFSDYTFNSIKSSNLRDNTKFSSGFEYRPQSDLGSTFWEQIIWRAGLSYEQTQYKINDTGINQFSVSGGCSLPFGAGNSLDLALVYSMRGTTDSNLLKENIVKLGVGISFGDIWFIRQDK